MGFIQDFDGKKNKLIILLELSVDPTVWKGKILNRYRVSSNCIYTRLRELENEGLVTIGEREATFPFEKKVRLTEKGNFVVTKLKEIEDYYERNVDPPQSFTIPPPREPPQPSSPSDFDSDAEMRFRREYSRLVG